MFSFFSKGHADGLPPPEAPKARGGKGYDQHARSKVNRLRNRAAYDYETVHAYIDATPVVHVAFPSGLTADEPWPAILPMIGCTGDFERYGGAPDGEYAAAGSSAETGPKDVYLHGYISARMFREGASSDEVPVSISATTVDGFKFALAPFHNSYLYRSAVVYGYASRVVDDAEREYALRRITDSVLHGRWDDSRQPVTATEQMSTGILKVRIESASAKKSTGMPADDKPDLQNEQLVANTWTGVVPLFAHLGTPIASPYNKAVLPKYMADAIDGLNARNRQDISNSIHTPK